MVLFIELLLTGCMCMRISHPRHHRHGGGTL